MRRGYGLLDLLFDGISAAADYIEDEQREKRGERQRNNVYLGDISGNRSLDFAELLRADMETEKAMRENTERQQREKYNFSDRNTGMDDLFANTGGMNTGSVQSSAAVSGSGSNDNSGGNRGGGSHGYWSD